MTAIPLKFAATVVRRGLEDFYTRTPVDLQSSGVPELDAVLGGGFPRGSLVELCGPASSGRTSLAFSLLAQATECQQTCAFVDVSDSLDPLSLAAAGVDLTRLLWIRCGEDRGQATNLESSSYFAATGREMKKAGDFDPGNKRPRQTRGWSHPRDLMRGVDQAIPRLMGRQAEFPESARIHVVARCAGEQVERDREPPRRGIRPPRVLPPVRESCARHEMGQEVRRGKPWKRLEQGLKTTDLLLHGGGWGVVVFDLGGISWVDARRINLSLWFRFRRAVENTPTILLLLAEEPSAKSCASVVLKCKRRVDHWSRTAAETPSGTATFEGFEVQGEVMRSRVLSQPADVARWQTLRP